MIKLFFSQVQIYLWMTHYHLRWTRAFWVRLKIPSSKDFNGASGKDHFVRSPFEIASSRFLMPMWPMNRFTAEADKLFPLRGKQACARARTHVPNLPKTYACTVRTRVRVTAFLRRTHVHYFISCLHRIWLFSLKFTFNLCFRRGKKSSNQILPIYSIFSRVFKKQLLSLIRISILFIQMKLFSWE